MPTAPGELCIHILSPGGAFPGPGAPLSLAACFCEAFAAVLEGAIQPEGGSARGHVPRHPDEERGSPSPEAKGGGDARWAEGRALSERAVRPALWRARGRKAPAGPVVGTEDTQPGGPDLAGNRKPAPCAGREHGPADGEARAGRGPASGTGGGFSSSSENRLLRLKSQCRSVSRSGRCPYGLNPVHPKRRLKAKPSELSRVETGIAADITR